MKKVILFLCSIFLFCCALGGCSKKVVVDGDFVVITVEIENVGKTATLQEYMDYLQTKNQLSYEISNGMVVSINGKKGKTNEYWMLYTSDVENAENTWGTCLYQGEEYGSAKVGAETLVVKDDCIYIWYLQAF